MSSWTYDEKLTLTAPVPQSGGAPPIESWEICRSKADVEEQRQIHGNIFEQEIINDSLVLEVLDDFCGADWKCLVTDPVTSAQFIVYIRNHNALLLLRHADFSAGVCQEPVLLVRENGQLRAIAKMMPECQDMLASIAKKNSFDCGKTRKWERGKIYHTATRADIYLGKYYVPFDDRTASFDISRTRHVSLDCPTDEPLTQQEVLDLSERYYLFNFMEKCPARQPSTFECDFDSYFEGDLRQRAIKVASNLSSDYCVYDIQRPLSCAMMSIDGRFSQEQLDLLDSVIAALKKEVDSGHYFYKEPLTAYEQARDAIAARVR